LIKSILKASVNKADCTRKRSLPWNFLLS